MIQHIQLPCLIINVCAVCQEDIPIVEEETGLVYDFWYDGKYLFCSELHAKIGIPR